MHISKKFGLNILGHKDIDFIDIDEVNDTRLYLDPYVIQAMNDDFCIEAKKCIDSFFTEVFAACKTQNRTRLRELLKYSSEPNETNLGMKTISKYGKGSTSAELFRKFLGFYRVVRKNPNTINKPLALCMYIKNFDKDHMSDLITNVIRKTLHGFTIEQCHKWNMPLSSENIFLGYYWDYNSLKWEKLYGPALFANAEKKLLLVPKIIVRSRYVFNVECYIKQYILKILQKWHIDNNTDMCTRKEYKNGNTKIQPPTLKELYSKEVVGTSPKDYAYTFSQTNAAYEEDFVKDIEARIRQGYGKMSDKRLDEIVYDSTVVLPKCS